VSGNCLARRREPHDDDVAILNGVVLPFETTSAGLDGRLLAAVLDHRLARDDLETDEALLHLGVNLARGSGRAVSRPACPDVNFAFPGGEEVDEVELAIRRADDTRRGRSVESEFGEEREPILRRKLADLRFVTSADGDDLGRLLRRMTGEELGEGVDGRIGRSYVRDVQDRLEGDERALANARPLRRGQSLPSRRDSFVQTLEHPLAVGGLANRVLLASTDALGEPTDLLLEGLRIGGHQFEIEELDVVDWVGRSTGRQLEAPDDVNENVGFLDVRQQTRAAPSVGCSALLEARNVDDVERRRDDLLRLVEIDELLDARIGDLDRCPMHLGTVEDRRACGSQRIEHRRLAAAGHTNQSTAKRHSIPFSFDVDQGKCCRRPHGIPLRGASPGAADGGEVALPRSGQRRVPSGAGAGGDREENGIKAATYQSYTEDSTLRAPLARLAPRLIGSIDRFVAGVCEEFPDAAEDVVARLTELTRSETPPEAPPRPATLDAQAPSRSICADRYPQLHAAHGALIRGLLDIDEETLVRGEDVELSQQRFIRARYVPNYVKLVALVEAIGRERAIAFMKTYLDRIVGEMPSPPDAPENLSEFRERQVAFNLEEQGMDWTQIVVGEHQYLNRVTVCRIQRVLAGYDPKLMEVVACYPDFAMLRKIHESFALTRTQTLMNGGTCCDTCYRDERYVRGFEHPPLSAFGEPPATT